jgi:hypothetical protein
LIEIAVGHFGRGGVSTVQLAFAMLLKEHLSIGGQLLLFDPILTGETAPAPFVITSGSHVSSIRYSTWKRPHQHAPRFPNMFLNIGLSSLTVLPHVKCMPCPV